MRLQLTKVKRIYMHGHRVVSPRENPERLVSSFSLHHDVDCERKEYMEELLLNDLPALFDRSLEYWHTGPGDHYSSCLQFNLIALELA